MAWEPLLTPQLDVCAAMSASLRDANTSQSVIDIFDGLERLLGLEVFRSVFPVLLTDNGTEFSNPGAMLPEGAPNATGRMSLKSSA